MVLFFVVGVNVNGMGITSSVYVETFENVSRWECYGLRNGGLTLSNGYGL